TSAAPIRVDTADACWDDLLRCHRRSMKFIVRRDIRDGGIVPKMVKRSIRHARRVTIKCVSVDEAVGQSVSTTMLSCNRPWIYSTTSQYHDVTMGRRTRTDRTRRTGRDRRHHHDQCTEERRESPLHYSPSQTCTAAQRQFPHSYHFAHA